MSKSIRCLRFVGRLLRLHGPAVAGALVLVHLSIAGNIQGGEWTSAGKSLDVWEHGWPWPFAERTVAAGSSRWAIWQGLDSGSFGLFTADLLVLVGLIGVVHLVNRFVLRPFLTAQWRLIHVFALLGVLAIPLAYAASILAAGRNWLRLQEELAQFDVNVSWSYGGPLWHQRLFEVDLSKPRQYPSGFMSIVAIVLHDAHSDTKEIARLASQLPDLAVVAFTDPEFDDDTVDWLFGLPQRATIDTVELSQTRISDRTLSHLTQLPALVALDVDGTNVSDQGILQLTKCSKLQQVLLFETRISDACVNDLLRLPAGCRVSVESTNISEVGMARLAERQLDEGANELPGETP
jgi:hypothetical protein